jgi:hypothetical protein
MTQRDGAKYISPQRCVRESARARNRGRWHDTRQSLQRVTQACATTRHITKNHQHQVCLLGPVDKAEPDFDRGEIDEGEEAFGSLVIAGGDAPGVLQFVEEALDLVA